MGGGRPRGPPLRFRSPFDFPQGERGCSRLAAGRASLDSPLRTGYRPRIGVRGRLCAGMTVWCGVTGGRRRGTLAGNCRQGVRREFGVEGDGGGGAAAGNTGAAGVGAHRDGRGVQPAVGIAAGEPVPGVRGAAAQGPGAPDAAAGRVGADGLRGRGHGAAGQQAVRERGAGLRLHPANQHAGPGPAGAHQDPGAGVARVHAALGGGAGAAHPGDGGRAAAGRRGEAALRRDWGPGVSAADHRHRGDAGGAAGGPGAVQ